MLIVADDSCSRAALHSRGRLCDESCPNCRTTKWRSGEFTLARYMNLRFEFTRCRIGTTRGARRILMEGGGGGEVTIFGWSTKIRREVLRRRTICHREICQRIIRGASTRSALVCCFSCFEMSLHERRTVHSARGFVVFTLRCVLFSSFLLVSSALRTMLRCN